MRENIEKNNRALKHIRKLSEWLVKNRLYRAENMREQLCALVVAQHGSGRERAAAASASKATKVSDLSAKE